MPEMVEDNCMASDQKAQQVFFATYLIYSSIFVSFKGDIGVSITVNK